MLELTRTVRLCVSDGGPMADPEAPKPNGYAGWPAMRGLGRYYEVRLCCRGQADPVTGYFLNITVMDRAVRRRVLPLLEQAVRDGRGHDAALGALLRRMVEQLQPELSGSLASLRLDLTPFYNLELRSSDMDRVIVRQQYEFAAAHRLHVAELSEAQNQQTFGKCNNPAGHGHNYRLEVALACPIDAQGRTLAPHALDELVDQTVLQPLDHKHLNLDVPAFARRNPSVENIARIIHGWLKDAVAQRFGPGTRLEEIRLWETEKTVCTYRGE